MARDKRPEQLPTRDVQGMSFADFIEYASGGNLDAPYHLGRYFDLMSTLDGGDLRICVSMPPQHGKSTTCHYAIAYALLRNPSLMFGFASYAKEFANDQTALIRDIYIAAGGEMKSDHNRKENWRTAQGGGLIACSPDSGLTGYRIDIMIVDDIVRDSLAIEDERARDKIWNWLHGVAFQRLWVNTSVIVIGTRWHPDDPIGRLIAKGFDEINMPAVRVDDDGNEFALWPDVKPLAWLDTKRRPLLPDGSPNRDFVGEHEWATQYQGRPMPREGTTFGRPRFYDALPAGAAVVSIGVDLAYDATTSSDWTVAVVLAQLGGMFFVHDVRRARAADVQPMLRQVMNDYPGIRLAMYVGGPEKGVLNLLFHNGIAIERMPARHNKWTRAQRVGGTWRGGRVLIRRGQPWTSKFALEVEFFTGAEHGTDDQVDALVAAHDLVAMNEPVEWAGRGFSFGSAVM